MSFLLSVIMVDYWGCNVTYRAHYSAKNSEILNMSGTWAIKFELPSQTGQIKKQKQTQTMQINKFQVNSFRTLEHSQSLQRWRITSADGIHFWSCKQIHQLLADSNNFFASKILFEGFSKMIQSMEASFGLQGSLTFENQFRPNRSFTWNSLRLITKGMSNLKEQVHHGFLVLPPNFLRKLSIFACSYKI